MKANKIIIAFSIAGLVGLTGCGEDNGEPTALTSSIPNKFKIRTCIFTNNDVGSLKN